MIKNYYLLLALILFNFAYAQKTPSYLAYNWEENPKPYEIEKNEDTLNYVNVKENQILEYIYEASGELVMYSTVHVKIHINNSKGIEQKNKVYISTSNIIELMDVKGRTILKNGKVINLPKSSIKKTDNLDNEGPFTYFVFEGVEENCDIEYVYTKKMSPYLYGAFTVQSNHQKKQFNYDFISPINLIFESKSYNGLSNAVKDTTEKEKNKFTITQINIPPAINEKYSAYDASKMCFGFKLAYNTARSKARLYTFDIAASDFYKTYFEVEKSELKSVSKLLKSAKIDDFKNPEEKIRELESYIKSNIFYQSDTKNLKFSEIIEFKIANHLGLTKLYIQCIKSLGLDVELVITTDRFERKFDPDFDNWNQLDEILLYIPEIDVYISPKNIQSRFEYLPPQYSNNKGLFIKEVSVGDIKSGASKIKTIKTLDYNKSYHNQNCIVNFKGESFLPVITNTISFNGYSAFYTQPYIHLMKQNDKDNLFKDLAKVEGPDSKLIEYTVENDKAEDVMRKPLLIKSTTNAQQLIEKAGEKYIFNVGALIGPQSELYQEGKRTTTPEIQYTHFFKRDIIIQIPQNYKAINLETLSKKVVFNGSSNSPCNFISNYEVKNNQIIISVYEDYKLLTYPINEFESYKNVINAAADFNKIKIIFEKN